LGCWAVRLLGARDPCSASGKPGRLFAGGCLAEDVPADHPPRRSNTTTVTLSPSSAHAQPAGAPAAAPPAQSAPAARDQTPSASDADVAQLVDADTAFTFDLYRLLRQEQEKNHEAAHLFFSPYSIHTALTVTKAGARGETEAQMAKMARWPRVRRFKRDAERLMADACRRKSRRHGTGQKPSAWHPAPDFTIDRPFIFVIRDLETGTILFMGYVGDPREEG
jgi:serine protease inhibitor